MTIFFLNFEYILCCVISLPRLMFCFCFKTLMMIFFMIKALIHGRVIRLQVVEGPKVIRAKGQDRWETTVLVQVQVQVRVQRYLGFSGSTWSANLINMMMILDLPQPNAYAPTIVTTTCHQHRVQIPTISTSIINLLLILIPTLTLITWYVTNHTTTRSCHATDRDWILNYFCRFRCKIV